MRTTPAALPALAATLLLTSRTFAEPEPAPNVEPAKPTPQERYLELALRYASGNDTERLAREVRDLHGPGPYIEEIRRCFSELESVSRKAPALTQVKVRVARLMLLAEDPRSRPAVCSRILATVQQEQDYAKRDEQVEAEVVRALQPPVALPPEVKEQQREQYLKAVRAAVQEWNEEELRIAIAALEGKLNPPSVPEQVKWYAEEIEELAGKLPERAVFQAESIKIAVAILRCETWGAIEDVVAPHASAGGK